MKALFRCSFLALLALATGCGQTGTPPNETAKPEPAVLQKIEYLIDWQAEPTYLGIYYAKSIGEFSKAGYDVTVVQSWGGNEAASSVAAGRYRFGTSSGGATVIANSKGADLVSLGVLYHKLPTAIFGLKTSGIKTPKDLEGKKIGIYPKSVTGDEFKAFAAANGVDLKKVTIVSISGPDLPLILAGQVQAGVNYFELSPTLLGFERETFELLLNDFGVKAYGLNMITARKTLTEDPALVKAMTTATLAGYRLGCENQAAAVDAFVKEFPEKDKKYVATSWGKVCGFIGGKYGDQDEAGWKQTIATYAKLGLADAALRADSIMKQP